MGNCTDRGTCFCDVGQVGMRMIPHLREDQVGTYLLHLFIALGILNGLKDLNEEELTGMCKELCYSMYLLRIIACCVRLPPKGFFCNFY